MEKTILTAQFETEAHRPDGGRIRIGSQLVDRRGRIFDQAGIQVQNYLKNPVVLYGHNYQDPWAVVGKTNSLDLVDLGLGSGPQWVADFTLREPATPEDPQHIVRALWAGQWINAASVGLVPQESGWTESDSPYADREGEVLRVEKSDLVEWSLLQVPANPDALRLTIQAGLAAYDPQLPALDQVLAWLLDQQNENLSGAPAGDPDGQQDPEPPPADPNTTDHSEQHRKLAAALEDLRIGIGEMSSKFGGKQNV